MRKEQIKCPCGYVPCRCMSIERSETQNKVACEILVYEPKGVADAQVGVQENLWIKSAYKNYQSIGVFVKEGKLQYYRFSERDENPQIYESLLDLVEEGDTLIDCYLMGHGKGSFYGLSNQDTIIAGEIDQLITHIKSINYSGLIVLEACNTDNQATEGKEKTFLEKLSESHPEFIFMGTYPWSKDDVETGYRSSGGYPTLNVPVLAMNGNVWKKGDSVIFFDNGIQYRAYVPVFASIETTMRYKINLIKFLENKSYAREDILAIALQGDKLKISDLGLGITSGSEKYFQIEERLEANDRNRYLDKVAMILTKPKADDEDILWLALGLVHQEVLQDKQELRSKILTNKCLLEKIWLSCGKVLIGSESNQGLMALCIKHGVNINVQCEEGMTVLHYAVNSFFNYRKEPCSLIQSLLALGVDQGIIDSQSRDIQGIIEDRKKDFRVKRLDDLATMFSSSIKDIGMFAKSAAAKPICFSVGGFSQDVGQGLIVD